MAGQSRYFLITPYIILFFPEKNATTFWYCIKTSFLFKFLFDGMQKRLSLLLLFFLAQYSEDNMNKSLTVL